MNNDGRKSILSKTIDVLTAGLLLGAVGLLVLQRVEARAAVKAERSARAYVSSHVPPPGHRLLEVGVVDSLATRTALFGPADAERRLVYVFKSDCPACAAQKQDWIELSQEAQRHGWAVTAVTAETLAQWVRNYLPPPVQVLRITDPVQAGDRLGVSVVPTTIVAGRNGRVISYHVGRMSSSAVDSLRQVLIHPEQ
jgi:hypothetical protein